MPDAIIKRVEYLSARDRRSGIYGIWRFCNRNHEIFSDVNEGDDEEPLIDQEVVHPDIPVKTPAVELECENTVSGFQEDDTDNPASVGVASAFALINYDITLLHHNEVPQVINEAPTVSNY